MKKVDICEERVWMRKKEEKIKLRKEKKTKGHTWVGVGKGYKKNLYLIKKNIIKYKRLDIKEKKIMKKL